MLKAIDPIDDRDARKAAQKVIDEAATQKLKRDALTLARAARQYHERVIEGHRSDKHSADWINSLEQHVPAALWHRAIAEVTAPELLDFFVAIRRSHRETGRRIVQRLCKIYSDAVFRGLANGNVAAAAAERLRELGIKREVISYAALPIEKVPRFIARLREREGIAARALEFAVLTAARTGEVLGATWEEFDFDARLWTVPADRMKGGERHVVYLSPRAIEIVESMRAFKQRYVFPGPKLDQTPLSNMAMLTLLRRMDAAKATTVHGLCRACFSTWAYETGAARPEVIEATLAHRESDRVKAAYMRADFARDRAALLLGWADFIDGRTPVSNVIDFRRVRVA